MKFPPVFSSTQSFRNAFITGLEGMLEHEGLGVFILVLANASYDRAVFERLSGHLQCRYTALVTACEAGMIDAPDDMAVFEKLAQTGFDQFSLTRFRTFGQWQVQYNPLRSYRPSRISNERVDSLCLPFDNNKFHFNKPFLKKEILWQGELMGEPVRLLYNKFPFADHHALLVLQPAENLPQVLTQQAHKTIWKLCESLANGMPGVGVGYNAYGAAASINHQHFQLYVRHAGVYPVELCEWQHNDGSQRYPLDCWRFEDSRQAWSFLVHLHEQNKAYNLLYRPGVIYIILRKMQGHFVYSEKLTGIGWSDVAGSVTVFTEQDFEEIDEAFLLSEYQKAALSAVD